MKKLISLLLCAVMVLGLLSACGGDAGSGTGNSGDKPVITIGIPLKTTVIDYETNSYTLWLEEELGIDIKFQVFATGSNDYMTQLSGLTLKEAKLPDILWNFTGMNGGTWDLYGQDEYLVDLTPYMEDKDGASKIWWERMANVEPEYLANILKRCEDDFGAMYVLPDVETSVVDTMDYMVSVNKTWLAECNLEQPTNIDEFYNMLVTFKEKMCSGKAGYYPLVGGGVTSLGGDVVNWIINMYLYYDESTYFALSDDGKTLTTPFTSDKYREALAFCKKLVDEGLLYYGLTREELSALVNPADGNIRTGMFVGHPTLTYVENDPSIEHFEALETYWGYCVRNEDQYELSAGITTDCADPDLAFELLMLACSEEGSYRLRYGVLGEDWDWADEGATSYLGLPCRIKVLEGSETLSTSTQNKALLKGPCILLYAENETVQYVDNGGWFNKRCDIAAGIYESFTKGEEHNPKYICPVMVLSELQSQTNEAERTNTMNLIYIMRDTFIRGTSNDTVLSGAKADINNDAHWQAYLDQLEKEGLSVWQAQMQEIYTNEFMDVVLGGN